MTEGVTPFPYETLKVPGEEGVFWCARHKNVQTRLRCGRCEKPICPKCTVFGPTGARCRDCGSNRSAHIYQVGAGHLALTFLAMLVLGAIGAALAGVVGLFLVFFSPVVGTVFGRIVTTITCGKRGPILASVATAGIVIGTLLVNLSLLASLTAPPGSPVNDALASLAYMLIYLALVIGSLWWWVK